MPIERLSEPRPIAVFGGAQAQEVIRQSERMGYKAVRLTAKLAFEERYAALEKVPSRLWKRGSLTGMVGKWSGAFGAPNEDSRKLLVELTRGYQFDILRNWYLASRA
jgi:hypothetical protein